MERVFELLELLNQNGTASVEFVTLENSTFMYNGVKKHFSSFKILVDDMEDKFFKSTYSPSQFYSSN